MHTSLTIRSILVIQLHEGVAAVTKVTFSQHNQIHKLTLLLTYLVEEGLLDLLNNRIVIHKILIFHSISKPVGALYIFNFNFFFFFFYLNVCYNQKARSGVKRTYITAENEQGGWLLTYYT